MSRGGAKLGLLAGVLALALIPLAMLPDFLLRLTPDPRAIPAPATGVVFTGQFERIETGLSLLSQGRISGVFISGVNSDAGTSRGRFPAQFQLDDSQRAALSAGQIVLGTRAESTLENALETVCWLQRQPPRQEGADTLVLITARGHMPRASRALEAMLPLANDGAHGLVLRLASGPDLSPQRLWGHEFPRHVLLRLILLLPEPLLRRLTGLDCPA